jgi:hypothetical protein
LALLLVAHLTAACAIVGDPAPNASAESVPEPAAPSVALSCTPEVGGLVPANVQPIEVTCPHDHVERAAFAAEPVSGRFKTRQELTAAFCVPTTTTTREPDVRFAPTPESNVDFEVSDVVVYAYDRRSSEAPALYERGRELWLRVTKDACSAAATDLASVAYVVPKGVDVNEQSCSRRCY